MTAVMQPISIDQNITILDRLDALEAKLNHFMNDATNSMEWLGMRCTNLEKTVGIQCDPPPPDPSTTL